MVELVITMTGKGYSPRDRFRIFGEDRKAFQSVTEAKTWLRENYGKAKRVPMYVDKDGAATKIGYVIGFRNSDMSHYPVSKWIQQDWIEFRSCEPMQLGAERRTA